MENIEKTLFKLCRENDNDRIIYILDNYKINIEYVENILFNNVYELKLYKVARYLLEYCRWSNIDGIHWGLWHVVNKNVEESRYIIEYCEKRNRKLEIHKHEDNLFRGVMYIECLKYMKYLYLHNYEKIKITKENHSNIVGNLKHILLLKKIYNNNRKRYVVNNCSINFIIDIYKHYILTYGYSYIIYFQPI